MRQYALLIGTTMNELPKVLPVWTNAAEQGLADLKVFAVDSRLHPDYGGAGVDVSVDGRGDIQCTALKHHDAKSTRLCARNITLPFGLPNTGKRFFSFLSGRPLLKMSVERQVF